MFPKCLTQNEVCVRRLGTLLQEFRGHPSHSRSSASQKIQKMSSQGAIRKMINTASLLLLAMVISPMQSMSFVPTVPIIRPHTTECSSLFMSSEGVTSSTVVRSRRGFINNALAVSFAVMAGISTLSPSFAEGDDINQLTDVYFGVGCFWHIQHEFGKHRNEYVYVIICTSGVLA